MCFRGKTLITSSHSLAESFVSAFQIILALVSGWMVHPEVGRGQVDLFVCLVCGILILYMCIKGCVLTEQIFFL